MKSSSLQFAAQMETLQDKLAQIRDAREALDALREDHREKLRREAEEAERIRQIQLAQKLEIMRQKKQVRCVMTSKGWKWTQNGVCNLRILHRYTREIPAPAPFLSLHGAQIGGLRVFTHHQNNRGLLGAYVTWIFCGVSVKINTLKMPRGEQRSWLRLFCICFVYVVSKNLKTPIWAPWLMPLHGSLYGVWDIPCISVVYYDRVPFQLDNDTRLWRMSFPTVA